MDEELGRQVNWLDLPTHLMDSISDKLMVHFTDFIRFGAVCHSWHSIYTHNRHRLPRQFPGLLLCTEPPTSTPTQPQDRKSHSFYDFIEKKIYKFQLQLPSIKYFLGSNHGWLIYENESQLFLFNPFLSVDNEIRLPPLTAFIAYSTWTDSDGDDYEFGKGLSFIRKAILCGNPASSSSYIVVATDTDSEIMAFYKSGDQEWTSVYYNFAYIEDFIYYKDQVYVLDGHQGLLAFDLSSHPEVSNVAPTISPAYVFRESPTYTNNAYGLLVESSGELLAVFNIGVDDETNIGIDAYKLDQNLFDWVGIKSLSGCSLFISDYFSLICSNYFGWKPNSVYVIPRTIGVGNRPEVVRVYNFENGCIESLYLPESNPSVHTTRVLIEPTLLGCPN